MIKSMFFAISIVYLYQVLLYADPMPPNSILGFGTQHINQGNAELVQDAINKGYRLFDTADMYRNIQVLAPIFKANNRSNLYIVYKINPYKKRDLQEVKSTIDSVVESMGYIDNLMLHSAEDFYNDADSDFTRDFVTYVETLIQNGMVKSFGASNLNFGIKSFIEKLKKINKNLKIEVLENKLDNSSLQLSSVKNDLSFARENNIKVIGYGALGGVIVEGICNLGTCNVYSPLVFLDEVSHPSVIGLSRKYNIDAMMLLLAFESKKFDIYQIPTTSSSQRLSTNFDLFKKAYNLLSPQDMDLISHDIGIAEPNEFSDIPKELREINLFRSRLRLIEHLQKTPNEVLKTLNNLKLVFNDAESNSDLNSQINQPANKLLFVYEQARKLNKTNKLDSILSGINQFFSLPNSHRFLPILKKLFSFEAKQLGGLLVDRFVDYLGPGALTELRLLDNRFFTLIDKSDPNKLYPQFGKLILINLGKNNLIKVDVDRRSKFTVENLISLLRENEISESMISDVNENYDLSKLDKDMDLRTDTDAGLWLSKSDTLLVGNDVEKTDKTWVDIVNIYDPFKFKFMYTR